MRILHVDPEGCWGGGETQVLGLMRYLNAWGHECELACDPRGVLMHRAEQLGLRCHALPVRNDIDFVAAARLYELLRRGQFEIVHFHTSRAHALSLWIVWRSGKSQWVVTRRMDYPVRNGIRSHLLFNNRVDGVIAISEKIRGVLVAAGVRKDRIAVIPDGVEVIDCDPVLAWESRSQWGVEPDESLVGVVASLHPRKGHAAVLRAARLLSDRGSKAHWVFCGDGPERKALQKQARELGVDQRVTFAGFRSDMPFVIAGLDVCVLPSLMEGLGVSLMEAMAMGKPVVASRVGGIPETVREGENGFLVAPGSAEGIAGRVEELIGSESLRSRMGESGRKIVQERFSMEGMARGNELFYRKLRPGDAL